jgi:hypothetical protein
MKHSFAEFSNLSSQLSSFRAWNVSSFAFRVSVEKSGVLVGLPLCVTCCFSVATFNILSLFCIFGFLTAIYLGGVSSLVLPMWCSESLLFLNDPLLFY